jgi:shikimate kinase
MMISLIGMSNVGKSHWSKKLETEQGFTRVCCDDLIAERLSNLLIDVDLTDMDAFAAWMGMPYEFGYQQREAAYLSTEQSVLEQAMESKEEKTIIDTTGSVIYLPEVVLHRLREVSTVVYLGVKDDQLEAMTQKFFAHPKPLVWGKVFTRHAHESAKQALRRCYPKLLSSRESEYEALGDVVIDYQTSHSSNFTSRDFLHDVLQHQQ